MERVYTRIIQKHLANYNQMVFLSGSRQVGKTTISQSLPRDYVSTYLNWDNVNHRKEILNLSDYFAPQNRLLGKKPLLILDEIHKFPDWKNYIKGFYDVYKDQNKILLTGSARLNIYKKGGDSLMGRYFNYSIFPLSVGELLKNNPDDIVHPPKKIDDDLYDALYEFGGFPEPFLKQSKEFSIMWQSLRFDQLFREDIRDLEGIKSLDQLELLAHIITDQTGRTLNYEALSNQVRVASNTMKSWLNLLENYYFCFTIKPWSTNISRSLLKEPKIYLYDWANVKDDGARFENFMACNLLKSVTMWNETGKGEYGLFYIRTKDKKEVDFVVTRENTPWMLIETKLSNNSSISKHLFLFKETLNVPYAFQVVHNMDYVDYDCFKEMNPIIVPAKTFLSQIF